VVRFAFNLARKRNQQLKVTCVDKSNIIGAHRFFREVFREVGQNEFPDLKLDYAYVDAFCQWQIRNPEWYDVVVAPNLPATSSATTARRLQAGWGSRSAAISATRTRCLNQSTAARRSTPAKTKRILWRRFFSVQMMLDWLGTRHEDDGLLRRQQKLKTPSRNFSAKERH
jgi:isocitrate/isopropylmalate dehydrogenase